MRRADPADPGLRTPDPGLRTLESRLQTLDSAAGGFTLLEVMVALAVLAVGIVTALELFAGSLRLGTKASHHTQAAIYAQNVMDRLFAQSTLDDGERAETYPVDMSGGHRCMRFILTRSIRGSSPSAKAPPTLSTSKRSRYA